MKHSILVLAALAAFLTLGSAAPQELESREAYALLSLASLSTDGVQGNSWSGGPALSEDGRFVAFHSYSDNLVAGDTNVHYDIFVHDRLMGSTERISLGPAGLQANRSSTFPSISADGRMVAFESYADNLVPGDDNGPWGNDVFVHDRASGVTRLVSRSTAGEHANAKSERPVISADGRFVVFESYASNLAPGTDGIVRQVYVHDLLSEETTLASIGHLGLPASHNCHRATISGDGRLVAFDSISGNLVAGDTNSTSDVFVRDRLAGTIVRVSVHSSGAQADSYSNSAALSHDGRFVAFQSGAAFVPDDDDGFFDIYVHDLATGETLGITAGDPTFTVSTSITRPSISGDGLRVVFQAAVVNYPFAEPSQVFLHDRTSGATTLLSRGFGGAGRDDSSLPAISSDGRTIVFESRATNLVPGDNNAAADVFLHRTGGL